MHDSSSGEDQVDYWSYYNNYHFVGEESSSSEMIFWLYYRTTDTSTFITAYDTISEMESLNSPTNYIKNYAEDPDFDSADGYWLLKSSSPALLRTGGLDDSPATTRQGVDYWGAIVVRDFFGNARTGNGTDGVSLGAHEIDP